MTSVARTSVPSNSNPSCRSSMPCTCKMMRSETSSPEFFRRSWTWRTTSRKYPRRSRPSSSVRSRAITSPPSLETANPPWLFTRSSMSSEPSSNTPVESVIATFPPASRVSAALTESSFNSAGFNSFTASPSRGPTVRKFGTSSKLSTSASSAPYSRTSTFSSSSTIPSGGIGAPTGKNTSARARGWRTLTPASAREARPREVSLRATSIDSSSATFLISGLLFGQSAR